eukprot:m.27203 g.27203  ORF g.27203 m.27203 type:complete len:874 (+) comp15704_c0_seq1:143-2764(+)
MEPVDPTYEFDAPQHFEFGNFNSNQNTPKLRDSWFDRRLDTPARNQIQKSAEIDFEKWEKDNEGCESVAPTSAPTSTVVQEVQPAAKQQSSLLGLESLSAESSTDTILHVADPNTALLTQSQPNNTADINLTTTDVTTSNLETPSLITSDSVMETNKENQNVVGIQDSTEPVSTPSKKSNKRRLVNLVTSWMESPKTKRNKVSASASSSASSSSTSTSTASKPSSKAKSGPKPPKTQRTTNQPIKKKSILSTMSTKARKVSAKEKESTNAPKPKAVVAPKKTSRKAPVVKKSSSKGLPRTNASTKEIASSPPKTPTNKGPRKLTKPVTPSVMKRPSSTTKRVMSTEEREYEAFQQKREEMAKRRKLSRSSFKRLSSSSGYAPTRSEKELTVPHTPNFKGANPLPRADLRDATTTVPSRPKEHGMVLRGKSAKNLNLPKRTVPKPFNLHKSKSTEDTTKSAPFVAVAQKVQKFFACTPERFRTRPKGNDGYQKSAIPFQPLERTVPVTPKLLTTDRAKPSTLLPTEEQLIRDLRSRQPFKANPVNDSVMNSAGDVGLPRVVPLGITIPDDVVLHTGSRNRPVEAQVEEPPVVFHARSIPDMSKISGLPEKKQMPATVPKPPATQLERTQHPQPKSPTMPQFKAQPLPDSSPFKPTLEHKRVVVAPFVGIESHKDPMLTRKRLAEIELHKLEEARKFKANPIPVDDISKGMPNVHSKEVTVPKPFDLKSEKIHLQRRQELKEQELQLERELKAAALFHASKPLDTSVAFVPAKSRQALTTINSFGLTLEQRLEQRKTYDQTITDQKRNEEQQMALLQKEHQLVVKREIANLRKTLVHKAKPVPTHKPRVVGHSTKPLTEPQSPSLGVKRQQVLRA